MNLSKENVKKIILILSAVVLLYCGLEHLSAVIAAVGYVISLIFPFLLGGAIAFVLNVPMRQIEEKLLGKMKNKKEGLFIQCIVCSLLPLITLFIPYLKFGISVPLLGKVMEQLTGMDLLKVMGNVNNLANSELADYLGSDFFSGIKTYIILMVLVIFVIPLILFIASAPDIVLTSPIVANTPDFPGNDNLYAASFARSCSVMPVLK